MGASKSSCEPKATTKKVKLKCSTWQLAREPVIAMSLGRDEILITLKVVVLSHWRLIHNKLACRERE